MYKEYRIEDERLSILRVVVPIIIFVIGILYYFNIRKLLSNDLGGIISIVFIIGPILLYSLFPYIYYRDTVTFDGTGIKCKHFHYTKEQLRKLPINVNLKNSDLGYSVITISDSGIKHKITIHKRFFTTIDEFEKDIVHIFHQYSGSQSDES